MPRPTLPTAKPARETRRLFLITRLRRACNCPAKDPKPTNPKPASPSLESKNKQRESPAKNRAIYKRNSLKETTKHSSPSSTCVNSRNCGHLDSQIKKQISLATFVGLQSFFVSLSAPVTQAIAIRVSRMRIRRNEYLLVFIMQTDTRHKKLNTRLYLNK